MAKEKKAPAAQPKDKKPLSRDTSRLAMLMTSPMSASGVRSMVLLYSALLTAMKIKRCSWR